MEKTMSLRIGIDDYEFVKRMAKENLSFYENHAKAH